MIWTIYHKFEIQVKMKNYFHTFVKEGSLILQRKRTTISKTFDRDFRTLFGCSLIVCGVIWVKCKFPRWVEPKHLLWALMFLKLYETEKTLATLAGIGDRQKFRETIWSILAKISNLKKSVVSQLFGLLLCNYFSFLIFLF